MSNTETFVLVFNEQHPPEGTRKDEMLNEALARLRRIFLSEIDVKGIKAVIMEENGSVLQDGDLVNRVSSIPIIHKMNGNILVLQAEAPDFESLTVYSDSIVLSSKNESPVVPNIPITILPPGEKLKLSLYIKTGSVASTHSVHFTPISTVYFRPIDEGDMEFVVELVRGYTESDFDLFYAQALDRMKKGGGPMEPKRLSRQKTTTIVDDFLA